MANWQPGSHLLLQLSMEMIPVKFNIPSVILLLAHSSVENSHLFPSQSASWLLPKSCSTRRLYKVTTLVTCLIVKSPTRPWPSVTQRSCTLEEKRREDFSLRATTFLHHIPSVLQCPATPELSWELQLCSLTGDRWQMIHNIWTSQRLWCSVTRSSYDAAARLPGLMKLSH